MRFDTHLIKVNKKNKPIKTGLFFSKIRIQHGLNTGRIFMRGDLQFKTQPDRKILNNTAVIIVWII